MAQLSINKYERQTDASNATVATTVPNKTTSTNEQMLYHEFKYFHMNINNNNNNHNRQINERRIIKITADATTSSCKCLNNNNNNNNSNNNNKNVLRKIKSMPNLRQQINITSIINHDDNDNQHIGNGSDSGSGSDNNHNYSNYDHYKTKQPMLLSFNGNGNTNAITTATTTITTATALETTTKLKSRKNVKELLLKSEISEIEQTPDCCVHYKRNAMFVTLCCNKSYKCRFCHDENEKHRLECKSVTELICTKCQTRQKVQECCQNCGIQFGKYTCLICNLFDDLDKQQYHCDECGICRVGGRENFFHCTVCNMCLPKHLLITGHRCIENISRSHCPICLVNIHTSRLPCYIPPCGHLIHNLCFEQLLQNGFYKCPICQMSLLDMTVLWEFLDLQQKLMSATVTEATTTTTIVPIKCDNNKVFQIFCNDCLKLSTTKFHVIGLKCLQCGSYNTTANNIKSNSSSSNNNSINNNSNSISNNENVNKGFTLLTEIKSIPANDTVIKFSRDHTK